MGWGETRTALPDPAGWIPDYSGMTGRRAGMTVDWCVGLGKGEGVWGGLALEIPRGTSEWEGEEEMDYRVGARE